MIRVSIVLSGAVTPAKARRFLKSARPGDEVVIVGPPPRGASARAPWPDDPRLRRIHSEGTFSHVIPDAVQGEAVLIVRSGDLLKPRTLDVLAGALEHEAVAVAGCRAFEKVTGRPLDPMRHVSLAVTSKRTNVFDGAVASHAAVTSVTEMVPSSTCLLTRTDALSREALAGFDAGPETSVVAGPIHLLRFALQHGSLALIPEGLVDVPQLSTEQVREIRGGPATIDFWWDLLEAEPGLSDLDLRRAYSTLLRRVSLLPLLDSDPERLIWIRSTIHALSARIHELQPSRIDPPGPRPRPGHSYIVAPHDWTISASSLLTAWTAAIADRSDVHLLLPDDGQGREHLDKAVVALGLGQCPESIALLPDASAVFIRVPAVFLGPGDPTTMVDLALEESNR
jgi:hypothetical protein